MFSYVSPEALVPSDHPLRAIRQLVNAALERLSGDFDQLYAAGGRDSIAPEISLPQPNTSSMRLRMRWLTS